MSPAYEKRVAILILQLFSFTVASTIGTDDQDIMEAVELLESQHEQSQRYTKKLSLLLNLPVLHNAERMPTARSQKDKRNMQSISYDVRVYNKK